MQNINPTKNRNRRAVFYLWVLGVPPTIGACSAIAFIALLSQLPAFGDSTMLVMLCMGLLAVPAMIGGPIAIYRGMTLAQDNELAYQVGETLRQSIGSAP